MPQLLILTYQNFTHCSRPGCVREACGARRRSEWTVHRSPCALWPQTPSLESQIFSGPELTEEETVTPPCKEKIRGGEVRASMTALYSAMSSGLRKGPWPWQVQTRVIPEILWSDGSPSATANFSSCMHFTQDDTECGP